MHAQQENMGESAMSELQRRSDVQKCPVCGSHVDAEAYHCPACRNYFCYHCRARMLKPDPQFQCVNQICGYYAKLICVQCEPFAQKEELPAVYAEPEDGYWPAWLVVVLVSAAVAWYFTSFLLAAGLAIAVYALGGYGLQSVGVNIFGRERKVEHRRTSSFHVCINCKQAAKESVGTT